MTQVTQLHAVLFDMDGTLVETESLWHQSEIMTMESFGSTWSPEEQRFALGGPFDTVVEYMAKKIGTTPDVVGQRLTDNIDTLMRSHPLPLQPGIQDLYAELKAAGIPIGLVTNSFRRLITIVLESTGLEFDVTIAGDELPENKPHPLPYLRACELLGVDPHHVAVLEDSSTGIASAQAAGCYVIAIPHLANINEADRQLVVPTASDVNLARLRQLVGDAA